FVYAGGVRILLTILSCRNHWHPISVLTRLYGGCGQMFTGIVREIGQAAKFVGLFTPAGRLLVQQLDLGEAVHEVGYVPHREVRAYLAEANVLWLIIGQRPGAHAISTGKLFEYMGTRKPILGLVPDGVAADTLHAYGNAEIVSPNDIEMIADAIVQYVEAWRGKALGWANDDAVAAYDRRESAKRMAKWLDDVV
ncbi:MAG: hypothetical protein AAGJ10_03675, partial [Bacteroidota bacterium]